jgi:hypothetical protein
MSSTITTRLDEHPEDPVDGSAGADVGSVSPARRRVRSFRVSREVLLALRGTSAGRIGERTCEEVVFAGDDQRGANTTATTMMTATATQVARVANQLMCAIVAWRTSVAATE